MLHKCMYMPYHRQKRSTREKCLAASDYFPFVRVARSLSKLLVKPKRILRATQTCKPVCVRGGAWGSAGALCFRMTLMGETFGGARTEKGNTHAHIVSITDERTRKTAVV